jgi:hypothetical protein
MANIARVLLLRTNESDPRTSVHGTKRTIEKRRIRSAFDP